MTKDEALAFDLALEALKSCSGVPHWPALQPAITAIKKVRALDKMAENARELGLDYEPVWCGHCNGSGRMVRDPDIGTDQECFVCDGAGVPAAPVQEPVVQNICIECANADSWGLPDKPACRSCVSNSEWKPLNVSSKNPATPPVQEPAEVLGHNGWGFPIKAAAPVQEDWGPGPHECHSLTASVQEPVAWRYRGILHDFDPSDWAEGPVTPLYTTPPAQPAPVQEPVAFFDPQGKGFYWAKPTKITAPVTVDVEPLPLYTTPPAGEKK